MKTIGRIFFLFTGAIIGVVLANGFSPTVKFFNDTISKLAEGEKVEVQSCQTFNLNDEVSDCTVMFNIIQNDESLSDHDRYAIQEFFHGFNLCQKLNIRTTYSANYEYYFNTRAASNIALTQENIDSRLCKWSMGVADLSVASNSLQPIYFLIKKIVLGSRYYNFRKLQKILLKEFDFTNTSLMELQFYEDSLVNTFHDYSLENNFNTSNDSVILGINPKSSIVLDQIHSEKDSYDAQVPGSSPFDNILENLNKHMNEVRLDFEESKENISLSLDDIEILEARKVAFDDIHKLKSEIKDTLTIYRNNIEELFNTTLSIERLLDKSHFVCENGDKVEIVFINEKTKVKSENPNLEGAKINFNGSLIYGEPFIDQYGGKKIFVYIKDKKNAWRLLPFLLFHELAHHNQDNYATSTFQQEKDADCYAIKSLQNINISDGKAYALASTVLFQELNLPGQGKHLGSEKRSALMSKCLNEYVPEHVNLEKQ